MSRYQPAIIRPGGGSGGGGIGGQDAFVAGVLVGNTLAGDPAASQAAPFEYVADPGDGSGIEAALASAGTRGVDVWLRPGTYTLDPATVTLPLSVPAGVTVRGAGEGLVTIVGGDGTGNTTQQVFSLGAGALLERVTVSSPAPAASPSVGPTQGVIALGSRAAVREVTLSMAVSAELARSQVYGIFGSAGDGIVENCTLVGADGYTQPAAPSNELVGIQFGTTKAFTAAAASATVSGCHVSLFNVGIAWDNCPGGIVENCELVDLAVGEAGLRWRTGAASNNQGVLQGPRWTGCRISYGSASSASGPSERVGALVDVAHAQPGGSDRVKDVLIDDLNVSFTTQTPETLQLAVGVWLRATADFATIQPAGAVRNLTVDGHMVGVRLTGSAINAVSEVSDLRVGAVNARGAASQGGTPGRGVWFEATASGQVNRCSIIDSSLGDVAAGDTGVEVTAGCTNCHVTGNELVPSGGTAYTDAGTGTEAGHNILV